MTLKFWIQNLWQKNLKSFVQVEWNKKLMQEWVNLASHTNKFSNCQLGHPCQGMLWNEVQKGILMQWGWHLIVKLSGYSQKLRTSWLHFEIRSNIFRKWIPFQAAITCALFWPANLIQKWLRTKDWVLRTEDWVSVIEDWGLRIEDWDWPKKL